MTQSERDLLLLLASVIGPSSKQWREIRELMSKVKEDAGE